jgi:hypothetical protein
VLTLSEDVIRFIRQHIHSVLQLEILLLLCSRRVDWTADKIADELRITERSAGVRLKDPTSTRIPISRCGGSFLRSPQS